MWRCSDWSHVRRGSVWPLSTGCRNRLFSMPRENTPMLKWLVLPIAVLASTAASVSAGASRDSDHDRLPDRWERKHHLSTNSPSARRDPDRDRLNNRRELRLRTHPRRADTDRRPVARRRRGPAVPYQSRRRDTDGERFSDRCELRKGTNPRKRRSHPKRHCSSSAPPDGWPAPSARRPQALGRTLPTRACPPERR